MRLNRRKFLLAAAAAPLAPAAIAGAVTPTAEEQGPWIHTPGDGRGERRVYVNGQLVEMVVYADERRGIVRVIEEPHRVILGELATQEMRGKVRVVGV